MNYLVWSGNPGMGAPHGGRIGNSSNLVSDWHMSCLGCPHIVHCVSGQPRVPGDFTPHMHTLTIMVEPQLPRRLQVIISGDVVRAVVCLS